MATIPLTKGYEAVIDDEDFGAVSAFKWTALISKNGRVYAYRRFGWNNEKRLWTGAIYLHRFLTAAPDGYDVDHKDHDGLNNRRANLRVTTRSKNLANSRRGVGQTGFRGVTFDKRAKSNAYIAQLSNKCVGRFQTAEDAAKAYDLAAKIKHGEFATLNFA